MNKLRFKRLQIHKDLTKVKPTVCETIRQLSTPPCANIKQTDVFRYRIYNIELDIRLSHSFLLVIRS